MRRTCDALSRGSTRRELLAAGFMAGAAALFPSVFLQASDSIRKETRGKYRRLLWIQMDGGAAGIDSFDPKEPSGSAHVLFPGIDTSEKGLRICKPFEPMANIMHLGALFRARVAGAKDHLQAMQLQLGVDREGAHFLMRHDARTSRTKFAFLESPGLIDSFPYRKQAFRVSEGMEFFWNKEEKHYPLPPLFHADPGSSNEETLQRIEERRTLASFVDRFSPNDLLRKHDDVRATAYDTIRKASEVTGNMKQGLVERYSPDGKRTPTEMIILAARELLRQGVFSSVLARGSENFAYGGWDTHEQAQRSTEHMAPRFAHAVAQLITDVQNGELGDDVVVVIDTEFGRESKINGDAYLGREHALTHSSLLFSPNVTGGAVIGRTGKDGQASGSLSQGIVTDEDFFRIVNEAVTIDKASRDAGIRREVPIFKS